ncbi:MAG: HYR domain-containing protein [Paludibacter sp.]|nr:MAG: HYR domain-containing protein [Paludibacter sp.]
MTVAVNESIGGTISGAVSPTCLNSGSGVLTLSGHLGTIVRWERNINSNGWTSIGNTGSTTFTEPNFYSAGTWQYRVVVKNGNCTEAYSSVANIVVDPASVGGSIGYADPICEGSSVSLTLNGSTGAILRWERRLGSGIWETVAQTTTIITDTPSSGGTWEYRAVVQSGNCNVVYSTSQTVVVNPTLTITLGANPEVCQTSASASLPYSATTGNPAGWILTFDAAAVSAGFNNPQNGSLTSAPGNIPFKVPYNIAVGVYHATLKIRTYSPVCFSTDYPVTITVGYSTVAGTASAGSTQVCRNSGTTLTLVGSVGSIQWQTNASGTWQDISGATSPTYVTPNLLAATSYRARVTSGSCSSMESNVVTITVDSEKPVLANCPTGTLTFAPDAGLCSASINTTTWGQSPAVSATDNCDTAPVINFTRSDGQTNSTFPIGSTTVTLTATDNNGNVSTGCTFTVLVRETTPPSITCPPGQTIFCAANIPAAYTTFAAFQAAGGTASDNAASGCGLSEGTFHLAAQVTSGSTITRTYEIADYSGNTATCNQVFTIISPPTVSITSPGFNITCAGSGFTIHSSVNSYSGTTHYQWQFKAFNGSSWTVVGGDTPSYSGTLANLGDQYRLIISQSTDFSNVSCTSISNELKFMDVTKPVFVIGNAPANQTICIANGATSASVTNIRLNNEDVADNCTTVFGDLAISYTINGGASVNGNLSEGTSFSLGTSTVVYTVADQSGNYETHTFTITVNENPALADITPDASGLTPDQGSTHSYSVPAEAGYTFTWSVEKEISSGNYSAVSPLITGQGSATVNITWGAATMPGDYRITVVKENNSTNCEATKTLNVKVLNVFNPFVKDYGNSCHNVTGETIIDWIVELSNNSMLGGTYNWSFKWRIKLEGTEIATGTESGVTALSKTISYTVNIGDGSEKNYRFEIYDVTDALGNQETNTTDDTDEVKIFAKPSIQF